MESAIFSLVGAVIGGLLPIVIKYLLFEKKKNLKNAEYLAIKVSFELEKFANRCFDIVNEDHREDEDGCYPTLKETPEFNPTSFYDIEWKSLPIKLMYEIFDFHNKIEDADTEIFIHMLYSDCDYFFEERQYKYAMLCIAATELSIKIRKHVGLPQRTLDPSKHDPIQYMKEKIFFIESERVKKQKFFESNLIREED